jgi:hypothetical protein
MRTSLIYHRVAMSAEREPYESPKLRGLRGELKHAIAVRDDCRAALDEVDKRVKTLDTAIAEQKAYEANK